MSSCACALLFLFPAANKSEAVILSNDGGALNTMVPENDPGWSNVGLHGGGAAIYLGNRWVITADHLQLAETITFNDIPSAVEGGSEIVLQNPTGLGLTPLTDLRLVRLQDDPGLPALPISQVRPAPGSEVVMIGRGRGRESEPTFWNVAARTKGEGWTETDGPPFDHAGFKWVANQTMRWGTNTIEDGSGLDPRDFDLEQGLLVYKSSVDVVSMITRFDDVGATDFESHATKGDSGGGVFYNSGGQWELSGIMVSSSMPDGQPNNAAVFGNLTVSADLSVYRDHINAIMTGTVLQAGDADQNLTFDQLDLIQVARAGKYRTGKPATWGEGDWNGAPGGVPGHPPAGDGVFDQFDVIAAQVNGRYLFGSYGQAIQPSDPSGEGRTAIVYNARTGELSVIAPESTKLTSVNIGSTSGIFTHEAATNLGGPFDVHGDDAIFKATLGSSFGSLSFGRVAQPSLSEAFVLNDLTVLGSLAGGGELGEVDLIYVPEPATLVFTLLGVSVLAVCRLRLQHAKFRA